MANTKNLYQKLIEIRKEIDSFTKDTEGYNYSYVSGSQVLSKIQHKMNELGVLLYPKMEGVNHSTFDYQAWNKTRKQMEDRTDFVISGQMTYVWQNADDPSELLEIPFMLFGQQDDISKAYGSALTYSERYFLLKFFNAPTDDADPDARNTTGKVNANRTASDKQLNFVTTLVKRKHDEREKQVELFNNMIATLNVSKDMTSWTSQDASKAIKYLQGEE